MAVEISRRHFTVEEYDKMGEAGILAEDDRVELIDGEIIEMSPIGSHHAACVTRLNMLLTRLADHNLIVTVQNPIRLNDDSEPQPDLALLKFRTDFYSDQLPTPSDILLVVEVADSSIEYDRMFKVPRYARDGIPEVWLVDLSRDTIEGYSRPLTAGYQVTWQKKRGDALIVPGLSGASVLVTDILGATVAG
ncbi:MAG TPA: Uma2 family endonuclease [Chloroflexia bacterium]|jgi:Uma2 family endonuclease